ncbi:TraC family protein [uncultured Meiothermus sp.]|jgi:conjugal transfer ATP-binding protein TraC|uniref:VirB4 family type IV secretion system protein n=1 Tax=uncultured Meiothermus sp. TaxID=157471 RepID=UPI002603226E|nr:TraC family protein [uncultured Meiothermus sp.]
MADTRLPYRAPNPLYAFFKGRYRVTNLVTQLPYHDLEEGLAFNAFGVRELAFEIDLGGDALGSPETLEERWKAYRLLLRSAVPVGERARFLVEFGPEGGERLAQYRQRISPEQPLLRAVLESRANLLEGLQLRGQTRAWRTYFSCTLGLGKRRSNPTLRPSELQDRLEEAHQLRGRLEAFLSRAKLRPRALETQEAFALMRRYLNVGVAEGQPPAFVPRHERPPLPSKAQIAQGADFPSLRRQLAASVWDTSNPGFLQIGDRFVTTVVLNGLPAHNLPGMLGRVLDSLEGLTGFLAVDLLHEEPLSARASLYKKEEKLDMLKDLGGLARDISTTRKQTQLTQAIHAMEESGDHTFGFGLGLVLVCRERQQVEAAKNRAISALNAFVGADPLCNGVQHPWVFLNLLPLAGLANDFRTQGYESDLAALLPYTQPRSGAAQSGILLRNRRDGLYGLDLLDPGLKNFNGCLLAPSGGGKTYAAQVLGAHLLNQGVSLMIMEHGENYKGFTQAYGGAYLALRPEGEVYNPFDLQPGQTEPDREQQDFLSAWVSAAIPELPDPADQAIKERLLRQGIEACYQNALTRSRDTAGAIQTHFAGTQLGALREYIGTLKELGGNRMSESERRVAATMAGQLANWTGSSLNGRMFDGKSTVHIKDNRVLYFSTWGLDANPGLRSAATLYMQYQMWRRATRDRAQPKRIFADEIWAALKHPSTRDLVMGFIRRGRTFNCGTFVINNSLMDLQEVPGLLESLSILLIGESRGVTGQYPRLFPDLTSGALEQIEGLSGQSGRYTEFLAWLRYKSGVDAEVVRFDSVPEEYWINTTSAAEVELRERLVEQWGFEEALRRLGKGETT